MIQTVTEISQWSDIPPQVVLQVRRNIEARIAYQHACRYAGRIGYSRPLWQQFKEKYFCYKGWET